MSPDVADEGLLHLRQLTGLRTLNLESRLFTDQGLRNITTLTNLQNLDLFGAKVTDNGCIYLRCVFYASRNSQQPGNIQFCCPLTFMTGQLPNVLCGCVSLDPSCCPVPARMACANETPWLSTLFECLEKHTVSACADKIAAGKGPLETACPAHPCWLWTMREQLAG